MTSGVCTKPHEGWPWKDGTSCGGRFEDHIPQSPLGIQHEYEAER